MNKSMADVFGELTFREQNGNHLVATRGDGSTVNFVFCTGEVNPLRLKDFEQRFFVEHEQPQKVRQRTKAKVGLKEALRRQNQSQVSALPSNLKNDAPHKHMIVYKGVVQK